MTRPNPLDSSISDGFVGPSLGRQLRRLRAWAVGGLLAWMALVAVATEWQARKVIESEVAAVAARTEQYRESAARLANQTFVELDKMTSILATQPFLEAVAGRYSDMGTGLSALPSEERARRLKVDPEAKRASEALADIVASLRYDLIYVLDRNGIAVASSDHKQKVSILGQEYADRAYFRDAMASGSGRMFVVQRMTRVPGFFFSARLGAAGSGRGVVVARQPADSFVNLLSRRRFEFAVLDGKGMVVSSSNPEFLLRHVADPDRQPPTAGELRDIYQLDRLDSIEVARPANPLHDAHWQVNGEPRLLSMSDLEGTGYRLAIVSRFYEVTSIRREYLAIGVLLALFGVPAALAIHAVLAGHARQRAASRQLASANERLAAANEEKNRYLGIAAHDLRNPLSSVRGLSQLMLEMPMPSDQQRELLSTVYRTSDEMLGLVNDLLDVAHIESGRIDLILAPCDVADLVVQRLQHLKPHAERKGITLRFNEGDVTPVVMDKARFGQVIDNLVSNAIKFSPAGSAVRILLESAGSEVRLVVEDEGPGFSEADRAGLFKNFQKLSARPTGGESSTGLGLSIAKKVVDTHGGSIAVEGAAGGGARFVVTMPAAGPAAQEKDHE